MDLTDAQRAAIGAPLSRPLMILAAAGSGKTLVLCHRILYLIQNGVSAKEILAVTFTRRAGQDLLSRLKLLSSNDKILVDGVRVGTFHSFCLSILRALPSQAKLAPGFTIFTPKMQLELLQELIHEWHLMHGKKCEGEMMKSEAYRIMKKIGQMQRKCESSAPNANPMLNWVLERYHSHLNTINAIDFNSFTSRTNEILDNSPGILDTLNMKFQHILVDEFQDTDAGQLKLLLSLSSIHHQVTIVGDDDQQIYSWRGAAGIQNFAAFPAAFPTATVVKLERNFRSTGAIVAAARSVISKNELRMKKTIGTTAPAGKLVTVCECRNNPCEVAAITSFISSSGAEMSEVAILYRVHRVGVELQHHLAAQGVPCRIKAAGGGDDGAGYGATGEAFADIIAVLRLILNESDDQACKRLLQLFCSDDFARLASFLEQLREASSSSSLLQSLKALRSYALGMNIESSSSSSSTKPWIGSIAEKFGSLKEVMKGVQVLVKVMADARQDLERLGFRDVVMNLLQQIGPYREEARAARLELANSAKGSGGMGFAGIKALLKEAASFDSENDLLKTTTQPASKSKNASYKQMRRLQKRSPGQSTSESDWVDRLRLFLDQIALKLHEYELGEVNETLSTQSGCVTLSTIHQAKGLEWPIVVLARANQGVLPVFDNEEVPQEILEEEKRLLYVTLTRAKASIMITYLVSDNGQRLLPSQFLADIPRGLVNRIVSYEHDVVTSTEKRKALD